MAAGESRARQQHVLRATLATAAGLQFLCAVLGWLPWSAVAGVCSAVGLAAPVQTPAAVLLVRGAGVLAAWVGLTLLLPTVNPRKYSGVIDVAIGMLVVAALAIALLGWRLHVAPAAYLGGAILSGGLAAALGALRGAATYRSY